MHLILYLGPVCLMAAVVFGVIGNAAEEMKMAVIGWLAFSFLGIIEKPRTLPEKVMTKGNAFLLAASIVFVVVTGYGMD